MIRLWKNLIPRIDILKNHPETLYLRKNPSLVFWYVLHNGRHTLTVAKEFGVDDMSEKNSWNLKI